MRAVIQRVHRAGVTVDGEVVGAISRGFLVLLGVVGTDTEKEAAWLARKVAGLRVFPDEAGLMNLPLSAVGGGVLVVSQFTLYGDCRRGNRPSFAQAAHPSLAEPLYERFCALLAAEGLPVATGRFGAMMDVDLVNWGPVTLLVDTP